MTEAQGYGPPSDGPPPNPGPKPEWLKKRLPEAAPLRSMEALLRRRGLHTVCESALCPNLGECFGQGTATFLIMGDVCTRNCGFCGVISAVPGPLDAEEPVKLAEAVAGLGLRHVVVTSVTRDDLPDGGAGHYVATISAVRAAVPEATIEVLVPDFAGNAEAIARVLAEGPDVFNHNLETVPRLYSLVRPQAVYERSLQVLLQAARGGTRRRQDRPHGGTGGDAGGSPRRAPRRAGGGGRRGHHRAVSSTLVVPPPRRGVRASVEIRGIWRLGPGTGPSSALGALRSQLISRGRKLRRGQAARGRIAGVAERAMRGKSLYPVPTPSYNDRRSYRW